MKRSLLALCALFVLAGCAALPPAPPESDVDTAKVAAIERAANQTGVRVIWINMPRKPVAQGG